MLGRRFEIPRLKTQIERRDRIMNDKENKDTPKEEIIIEPGKIVPGKGGLPLEEKMERPRPWPDPPAEESPPSGDESGEGEKE